jgi:hypothetical protein
MAKRNLSNTTTEDAKKSGWVVDAGSPTIWETVVKVHNDSIGMMKSTKRMKVEGGYLYQVSTEGPMGYAEALQFVKTEEQRLRPQVVGRNQAGLRHR